jgi:hypothetical protein
LPAPHLTAMQSRFSLAARVRFSQPSHRPATRVARAIADSAGDEDQLSHLNANIKEQQRYGNPSSRLAHLGQWHLTLLSGSLSIWRIQLVNGSHLRKIWATKLSNIIVRYPTMVMRSVAVRPCCLRPDTPGEPVWPQVIYRQIDREAQVSTSVETSVSRRPGRSSLPTLMTRLRLGCVAMRRIAAFCRVDAQKC